MRVDLRISQEVVADLNPDRIRNSCAPSTVMRGVRISQPQMPAKKGDSEENGVASCESDLVDAAGQSEDTATRDLEPSALRNRNETDAPKSSMTGTDDSLS